MANFQKCPTDKNSRYDSGVGRLVVTLGETGKIDLFGGGPGGIDLVVDVNDPSVATVSSRPVARKGWVLTYAVTPLKAGNAMLEARLFDMSPTDYQAQRRVWFDKAVWAHCQISVMGGEFAQGDSRWGNLKYGSTNPAWKNVTWTSVGEAGCGPTSLAIIFDYLMRLDPHFPQGPACYPATNPVETMNYTSQYGRTAVNGIPQGTSGDVMVNNIGRWWPEFAGEQIAGAGGKKIDTAISHLRAGRPLLFLAKGQTTYKYAANGSKDTKKWPGHFMVLLGVESDGNVFWISDPSRARHKFIDRSELQNCFIWRIYRRA